jgi:hypothetical protein
MPVCGLQATFFEEETKRSSRKKEESETLAAILYGFMPYIM